jgi:hypothetical protein
MSKHNDETSSSLPAGTTMVPRRRSSEHPSNQKPHLDSSQAAASHHTPVPPAVDLAPTNGSNLAHANGTRKVNTTKSPFSTPSHPSTIPQPQEVMMMTCPLDSRAPPVPSNLPFPFLFSIPSSVPLHLPPPPIDSRASAPVNPPLGSIDMLPRQIHPLPPPPLPLVSGIPYVARIKGRAAVLGMPLDDAKAGGMRGSFPKDLEPPPNPSCSVVMEILPRKFRTQSFIHDWLSQFRFQPRRYELVEGKAFFEFKNERDVRLAWHSPRMGGLDGLLSVRLFRYRGLPQPVLENMGIIQRVGTTRTIENPAQQPRSQSVSVSSTEDLVLDDHSGLKLDLSPSPIPTNRPASPPPLPHFSIANVETHPRLSTNRLVENTRSNSDDQTFRSPTSPKQSFVNSSTPSPPTTTSSDPLDDQMISDHATIGDLSPGGFPGFIKGAVVSMLDSTPQPTISSSTLTSTPSPTSLSFLPTFPPETPDLSVTTMSVDHESSPIAMNQEQVPQPAVEISLLGAEIKRTEFENVDGTPSDMDEQMDTTDDAALAKEQALREMVLQSRKRRLLEAPSNRQRTPATTLAATSRNALEDLAVNFIADAIARPRPPKRVKMTPSPSAMAAWGRRLEQHVQSSKAIMAKIQSTQSRSERNRLMTILREKDRCVSPKYMLDSV